MEISELERIIDRAKIERSTVLDLSCQQLTRLPDSIGELTDLTGLNLEDNQLASLPENIGNLTNLKTLILDYNYLAILPARIGDLSQLSSLRLDNNRLKTLPEYICKLSNLQFLSLAYNRLATLPASISNLAKLIWCFLGNSKKPDLIPMSIINLPESEREREFTRLWRRERNQLTELPASFGNLSSLKSLTLDGNHLESLPHSFGNLGCLDELLLSDNGLTSLPEALGKLKNLSFLDLISNPLRDLSILDRIESLSSVLFMGVIFRPGNRRYFSKLSEWRSAWLLDERNAEIRRVLISQLGYEKICNELKAIASNTWREYTLLKIDGLQPIYNEDGEPVDTEPIVLLKMTCPSTGHIHILRVPPEIESAEAAITWVNHGIHPDEIAVQT